LQNVFKSLKTLILKYGKILSSLRDPYVLFYAVTAIFAQIHTVSTPPHFQRILFVLFLKANKIHIFLFKSDIPLIFIVYHCTWRYNYPQSIK